MSASGAKRTLAVTGRPPLPLGLGAVRCYKSPLSTAAPPCRQLWPLSLRIERWDRRHVKLTDEWEAQ
jgi:hypothetical protein